jgi:hypothetical protein
VPVLLAVVVEVAVPVLLAVVVEVAVPLLLAPPLLELLLELLLDVPPPLELLDELSSSPPRRPQPVATATSIIEPKRTLPREAKRRVARRVSMKIPTTEGCRVCPTNSTTFKPARPSPRKRENKKSPDFSGLSHGRCRI